MRRFNWELAIVLVALIMIALAVLVCFDRAFSVSEPVRLERTQ